MRCVLNPCMRAPAGKAHDVMALKCRGAQSPLNFGLEEYDDLLPMLPASPRCTVPT